MDVTHILDQMDAHSRDRYETALRNLAALFQSMNPTEPLLVLAKDIVDKALEDEED